MANLYCIAGIANSYYIIHTCMQASPNRWISVPDTPNVLYAVLPDIAKYLNIDVVVMYICFRKDA